ncbi:MAG: hypothetical protein ACRDYU_00105 [Actinomycetes bacterium]
MIRCETCGQDLEPFDYLTHACVKQGPRLRMKVIRADGRVEWFSPTADVVLGPRDRFVIVPDVPDDGEPHAHEAPPDR